MAKKIDKLLGMRLDNIRLQQNMSLERLSKASGLGVITVQKMLKKGELGEIDTIDRVLCALGISDVMSAIRSIVPDVSISPYPMGNNKKRASKSPGKNMPKKTIVWPEDNK